MTFLQAVSIKDHPRINDWLHRVENEMRSTLAQLLAKSLQDYTKLTSGKVDIGDYMKWLDAYPVTFPLSFCYYLI